MGDDVSHRRRDGVVRLTIERPEQMNAISPGVVRELHAHVEAARTEPGDRVVVVTGSGRAFCAGAHLREARQLASSAADFRDWPVGWRDAFRAVERCPKPVGSTLTAAEARDWGLVQHVVPADRFAEEVHGIAAGMAARSQPSLASMKRLSASRAVDDDGLDLELEAAAHVVAGPDAREGLAAFAEEREPVATATLTR